jgi:predicted metal-dependent phosphoesterase TrpH
MIAAEGFIDLHLHTTHSDGAYTPEEVVALARRARLSAISITDHDTIEGIAPAAAAARRAGIEFIPGVELSASLGHSDIHILGYFIDPTRDGLEEELEILRDGRFVRARRTVELLDEIGAPVSFERVVEIAATAPIGRPHIASALVEAGHAANIDQAFERYIGYHARAYVPKRTLDPAGAIDLVRGVGGVAVLAHPGTLRRDDLIPGLKAKGLLGIEVWHPKHDATRVRHYQAMAESLGLVVTGGSDFHGGGRGDSTVGERPVPDSVLPPIRALSRAL